MVAGNVTTSLSPALTLMLREFHDARPVDRVRLAHVWGVRPGTPAAAALGVPATDADDTDATS